MATLCRLMTPLAVLLLAASAAWGCPLCESETGRQVRAGIFDESFGTNVVLTLLPIPVLAAVVALIYYAPNFPQRHNGGGQPCRPRSTPTDDPSSPPAP